jgi:hypothetical protein
MHKDNKMKNNKHIAKAMVLAAAFFLTPALASDVYIDQIGDDVQINITQNNGMNLVNTDPNPAVVHGDGIRIDVLQDGDQNTADISLSNNSDGTVLDYSATGSFNELTVDLATAIDNEIRATVDGDNNTISVCGDLACTASMTVSDTVNVIDIDGSYNTVRLALDSKSSVNTVVIDGGSIGNGNTVDITQTGATGGHVTNVGIAGGSNSVTIIQGQ